MNWMLVAVSFVGICYIPKLLIPDDYLANVLSIGLLWVLRKDKADSEVYKSWGLGVALWVVWPNEC